MGFLDLFKFFLNTGKFVIAFKEGGLLEHF